MMMRESSEPKGANAVKAPKFTILDGDRRFKQTDWGKAPMPNCQADFLDTHITCHEPGEFDCPITNGPWADLCRTHAIRFSTPGSSLGFHRVRQS